MRKDSIGWSIPHACGVLVKERRGRHRLTAVFDRDARDYDVIIETSPAFIIIAKKIRSITMFELWIAFSEKFVHALVKIFLFFGVVITMISVGYQLDHLSVMNEERRKKWMRISAVPDRFH